MKSHKSQIYSTIALLSGESHPQVRLSGTDMTHLSMQTRLIQFLQEELSIPKDAIEVALRQQEPIPSLLPMILWQYGLVTLEQLDKIFDWLETA
jgi:hypothetical protein